MKRILVCLLCLALLCGLSCAAAEPGETELLISGDYQYVLLPDGTAEIWKCTGTEAELSIPSSLDGVTVSAIGDDAFSLLLDLTSASIPDSVVRVGSNPFRYCIKLTEVKVSSDHPALAIADGALLSKADHRLVWYPMTGTAETYTVPADIEVIGDYAFFYCNRLTSVVLPDGLTSVGNSAFAWCWSLAGIDIPASVRSIGDYAFSYCRAMTSFAYPDGVTSVGKYAFFFCRGLTSVFLPDSVVTIGQSAFDSCYSLSDVRIPDGVTFIGDSAFYGCTPLTSLTVPASVAVIEKEAFDNNPNLTLTVEKGSPAEQYCEENGLRYVLADAA